MANSVLLHLCCGPCGIMPVKRLREEGFAVTGVFYNPNIHPLGEYLKRRAAVLEAARLLSLPLLRPVPEDAAWDLPAWLRMVPGHENRAMRCRACYALRFERAAWWAKEQGFDFFSTSLLYSRHQLHELIVEEGERAAARAGVSFLYRDFRPAWKEGIALSKTWNLYRQNWCACIYSETERYSGELRRTAATPPEGLVARPVSCPVL